MKRVFMVFLLLCSCTKDYSVEYFKMYNADAPNRLMSKSKDFKSVELITYEKFSYDIFLVRLFYLNSKKELDSSYGQFNHNGKLLTFEN